MMGEVAVKTNGRVPFYEIAYIANDGSIRTFHKKVYHVRGIMVKESLTGEVLKLSDIYYNIRTVKNKKGQVIAKRKNPIDELKRV